MILGFCLSCEYKGGWLDVWWKRIGSMHTCMCDKEIRRRWERLVEGGGGRLVGPTWPQTVPLPAPELLLTSDSSAPTALDRLLLPLTCACFLIARELFMLHVSSSKLGTFTDDPAPPYWTDIKKGRENQGRGCRLDCAFISCSFL